MARYKFNKGDKVVPLPNRKSSNGFNFSKNCIFEMCNHYDEPYNYLVKVKILQGPVQTNGANGTHTYNKDQIMTLYVNSIQLLPSTADSYKIF